MKHEESSHGDSPNRKQPRQKDKQHDRVTEHKTRIKQRTNKVKEGFINSNEVTANTLNGANRPQLQLENMIQGSLNKKPPQDFIHQWIVPTNLYRGNPLPTFNPQLPTQANTLIMNRRGPIQGKTPNR